MPNVIRAGTSGYSYKSWCGDFYPAGTKSQDYLSAYAAQLPTVEINNTFYRMPKTHVLEQWRDQVPEDFRFVIKASRRITHMGRLKNVDEATGYLLRGLDVLGEKLGCVLFQLPPNMRLDRDRLLAFQDLLPESLPVAFEFRHESWNDVDVDALLSARNHALVINDETGQKPKAMPGGPLIYARLRAESYSPRVLKQWHAQIAAADSEQSFVFFKHEESAAGPQLALNFMALDRPGAPAKAGRKKAVARPVRAPRKTAAKQKSSARRAKG